MTVVKANKVAFWLRDSPWPLYRFVPVVKVAALRERHPPFPTRRPLRCSKLLRGTRSREKETARFSAFFSFTRYGVTLEPSCEIGVMAETNRFANVSRGCAAT